MKNTTCFRAVLAICAALTFGRASASVGTHESFVMGQGTLYLQGSQSSYSGTAGITVGNLSMSYDGGTTWVNQAATGRATTSAAWASIRGSGSTSSSETVPWQGYAKIYWPAGLSDGHGYTYQHVTVTYNIDDVGFATAMAWSSGYSATAYSYSDDGIDAYASQSGSNSADDDDWVDELPSFTGHTYTSATYSISDLTPIPGQTGWYTTPTTAFFSSYLSSTAINVGVQSPKSNGTGAQADVFFDTSGVHGLGANAITFS